MKEQQPDRLDNINVERWTDTKSKPWQAGKGMWSVGRSWWNRENEDLENFRMFVDKEQIVAYSVIKEIGKHKNTNYFLLHHRSVSFSNPRPVSPQDCTFSFPSLS